MPSQLKKFLFVRCGIPSQTRDGRTLPCPRELSEQLSENMAGMAALNTQIRLEPTQPNRDKVLIMIKPVRPLFPYHRTGLLEMM